MPRHFDAFPDPAYGPPFGVPGACACRNQSDGGRHSQHRGKAPGIFIRTDLQRIRVQICGGNRLTLSSDFFPAFQILWPFRILTAIPVRPARLPAADRRRGLIGRFIITEPHPAEAEFDAPGIGCIGPNRECACHRSVNVCHLSLLPKIFFFSGELVSSSGAACLSVITCRAADGDPNSFVQTAA